MQAFDRDSAFEAAVKSVVAAPAAPRPLVCEPAQPYVVGSWDAIGSGRDLWRTEHALRTVVDFIASKIATLPWHAYRMDGRDRVRAEGTDLARLVARPSCVPAQTRADLIHAVVVDSLLFDRFMLMVVMVHGEWRLRRIPPEDFSVDFNALGEPARVRLNGADGRGASYDLPDERVILSLGYGGASGYPAPVPSSIRPLLDEARELACYRRSVAKNAGRVPAWVSRAAGVPWASEQAREDFVTGLRAYRRGGGAEGGWPLLEDGMQIHELSAFKPVDVADLDARRDIAIHVCNAYHVSPENVGFRVSDKSGMQAAKEQLWNVELRPYIVRLEQALNLDLPATVGEPDSWIEANLDAQLRGTTSEQYQALSTATGRPFMATDEARRILNLPTMGDGYDKPVTPLNVLNGNAPSPQDGGVTQNAQQGRKPGGRD